MNKNRLQKLAGLLKESEDFDLSDNPLQGSKLFYRKHYAILINEDEEIVGFKDVVDEDDFFDRVNKKRDESLDFKQAFDFLIENEPFFCEKYPQDGYEEEEFVEPDYILTFDEWAEKVKATIVNYREPLDEEDDFDLSDNPVAGQLLVKHWYTVPDFEINLFDKGEDWLVDVVVEEYIYTNGRVKWVNKITKAVDFSESDYNNEVTDPQIIKYLEDVLQSDEKVAKEFDKALDYAMKDEYGDDEDDDEPNWDEWERNPER
jgi:hypothetical protein